jgi:uncharacterized protein YndB with AHSA1/START domain
VSTRAVTVERVIAAPAQRIFDLLADPGQHPAIDGSGSVHHPGVTAPARLFPGATFVMRMRMRPPSHHPADLLQVCVAVVNMGRITNTVVEFEEGRRLAWRNFGGHVWRWQLRPLDDASTLVRETFDYSTNSFPPLLELVRFPARNAEGMTATFDRLVALLNRQDQRT